MDHGIRPKVVLTDVPAHATQLGRGSRVPNGNIGEDILGVVSVHVIVAAVSQRHGQGRREARRRRLAGEDSNRMAGGTKSLRKPNRLKSNAWAPGDRFRR
jgi:hypothetical protein